MLLDDQCRHQRRDRDHVARHGFPRERSNAPMTAWPRALLALRKLFQGSSTFTRSRPQRPSSLRPGELVICVWAVPSGFITQS